MLKQELQNRIKYLQMTMKKHSLDCYIITAEEDIWYFTNLTYKPEERPFFLMVTSAQKPILIVPKLEESHVYKGILDCEVLTYWDYPSPIGENWYEIVADALKTFHRTGIEENVKAEVLIKIEAKDVVPLSLVAVQRKVKSQYEVEKIRFSAKITDKAIDRIFKSVYSGATVIEPFALSRNIQMDLIREKLFDPITTSLLTAVWPAPISSMPHSVPNLTDQLGEGPNVAMAYFRINGYAAECERTFFFDNPTKDEQTLFQYMMEARERSLRVLKAGVRAADIDSEAREYLIKNGLENHLLHRTGHGVGIGNHEAPFIAEGSTEVLQENMVITIEPGIYIDGIGGYRHSDTILITKDGYELLTKAPLEISDVVIKNTSMFAKMKGIIMQKTLKID